MRGKKCSMQLIEEIGGEEDTFDKTITDSKEGEEISQIKSEFAGGNEELIKVTDSTEIRKELSELPVI